MNTKPNINSPPVTTSAVDHLNALIEEFDTLTGGRLDKVHDPLALFALAKVWPGARPDLGRELYAAAEAVRREGGGL